METDGGGWLVIQRRINGSVDFYRNWADYVSGFGDLEGEFRYGLENIHCLTTREDVELRIEVGNETTPSIVWTYQLFRVGGAETNYVLTIGEGQGTGSPETWWFIAMGGPLAHETVTTTAGVATVLQCSVERGGILLAFKLTSMEGIPIILQKMDKAIHYLVLTGSAGTTGPTGRILITLWLQ